MDFSIQGTAAPILLLCLISMEFSQAYFHISNQAFTWPEANNECTPATPKITAAAHSLSVYSVENLGIEIPENETLWVGYYQVVRVFEYIGCVEQEQLFSIRSWPQQHVEIKGDPGHCFPGCGESTIVAVTKTRCYCLGDSWTSNITIVRNQCNTKCDHPPVACGNEDYAEDIYLSIYKINPSVDQSAIKILDYGKEETNCLCLQPSVPKTYYWSSCISSLLNMCSRGNEPIVHSRQGIFKTWLQSANTCFAQSLSPTNYSNSKNVISKQDGSQLWTGCFKTRVAYKHNTNIPANRKHDQKKFGHLYMETPTKLKVNFSDSSLVKKRVLCGKGHEDATNQMPTKETRRLSKTLLKNNKHTDMSDNGVHIAIGASSAALVFVAAFIVLLIVFLKRRRNKIPNQCQHNEETDQDDENDFNNPNLIGQNTPQASNNYFTLQPHEKVASENVTYDTTDENVAYDTTEASREYGIINIENVYNQLDNNQKQTYDHALAQNMNRTVELNDKSYDDTYDSTAAENKTTINVHTDNIYNKTDDFNESAYNHLDDKHIQTVPDNVYSVTSHNI